jgi:hypothetical protein
MVIRAVHLLACAVFALPLISTVHLAWPVPLVVGSILIVSFLEPEDALLIIAGLLPLSTPLGQLVRPSLAGSHAGELLLLSFLSGASARYALSGVASPHPFRLAAACGAAIVVASAIVGQGVEASGAAAIAERCWRHMTTRYLTEAAAFPALHYGMVWLEGLCLAYLADLMLRRRPEIADRLCRMLIVGASGASVFAVTRLVDELIRRQLSLPSTLDALSATRIGIHTPDINAVGSLYALFVVPALWSAIAFRRFWRWAAFVSIAVALWWTGSRAAVAASCCGALAAAVLSRRVSWRAVGWGLAFSAVLVVLSLRWHSNGQLSAADALRIRFEMGRTGFLIAAQHAAFGVGPGQFPIASRQFLSDRLLALFPVAVDGENAHNSFIQIVAEFGVLGACALLGFIALPLLTSSQAIRAPGAHAELPGFVGGLCAFLLTCLLGHPFLLPLCLWLFFLTLGIVSGLTSGAAPPGRRLEGATLFFVLLVAASIPWRIVRAAPLSVDRSAAPAKTGADTGSVDGIAYTTIERHYALYIDASAHAVTLPMRLAPGTPSSCAVRISMNRRPADIVVPQTDAWLNVRYVVREAENGQPGRLDLLVGRPNCRVRVGQLIVE